MADSEGVRVAILETEIAALRREVGIAHKAHEDLHVEANKVREKDAEVMQARLVQMNEFREEGRLVQRTYLRTEVYESNHVAVLEKLAVLERGSASLESLAQLDKRLTAAEQTVAATSAKLVGQALGVSSTMVMLGGIAVLITIVVSVATVLSR